MPDKTAKTRPGRGFAQQLRRLLSTEGYRPRLDSGDGRPSTLHFKVEGDEYELRCEDDADFVQLCTGYLLESVSQDELTLLRTANDVQNQVKVAKVYIPGSRKYVEFQVELFLGGQPLKPDLLQRCISILRYSYREFYRRITPELPRARA